MTMTRAVRNHGVPGLRDKGGVFTDYISADASLSDLRIEKQKLIAQRTEVGVRLAPLTAKIQAGEGATEAELTLLGELNAEGRTLNAKLAHVQSVLALAEEQQERTEAATRRAKFDELVGRSPALRAEFTHKFKEVCLLLGRLCADVDSVVEIANQLSLSTAYGLSEVDRNSLRDMSAPIDPLPALLDEFSPTTKFGWNLRISVPALRKEP